MTLNSTNTQHRCSKGTRCVAYSVLGEPAKLSRGNPGTRCFACEEHRVASELREAAAKNKVVPGSRHNEEHHPTDGGEFKSPTCAIRLCGRTAIEWEEWSHVCREHAETSRLCALQKRHSMWVLTCDRNLRWARASGEERLARKWSRLLREAEKRLAWIEATLAKAEARALSADAR